MTRPAEDRTSRETITWIRPWTDHLFSFRLTRPASFRFVAGQFARLGVTTSPGAVAWRAYSMVSGPYDDFLEFYSIVVPGGEFTSELAHLQVGDSLLIDRQSHGFLTLDRFNDGRELWLLSTGTGIAPFLSILSDPSCWERFERIILVHSVRVVAELAYRDHIEGLRHHELFGEMADKLTYIPVITREHVDGMASRRITELIVSGELESQAGLPLSIDHSRIMLCGNPEMVDDTRRCLKIRGFRTSRQSAPGQIAVENYW